MQPLSSQPALPVAWTQVLDNVEATLRRTEAAAAEREQALGGVPQSSDPDEERQTQWHLCLGRFEEQRQGWQTGLQQAEKEASVADALLGAAEDALRRWLAAAEGMQQRLADWASREV